MSTNRLICDRHEETRAWNARNAYHREQATGESRSSMFREWSSRDTAARERASTIKSDYEERLEACGECIEGCWGRIGVCIENGKNFQRTRKEFDEQMKAASIKTCDMFTKTILGIEDPSQLCQFLQNLDLEETAKQEAEEKLIQQARIQSKACFNIVSAVFAGTTTAVVSNIVSIVFPIAAPIGWLAPLVASTAAGLVSDNTDGFGCATGDAEKNLDIQNIRVCRLEDKVRKIAAERAAQGKTPEELDQLTRTETLFTRIISQYRTVETRYTAWIASESKKD
jgi:hypothetical protein